MYVCMYVAKRSKKKKYYVEKNLYESEILNGI